MIRKSEEKVTVRKPAPFNGVGEITVRSLLNGPEEMSQKGRVFGHTTVYPGSEIGYHIHTDDRFCLPAAALFREFVGRIG